MGAVHRICRGETLVVGFVAFFVGITVTYIATLYSGHEIGHSGGRTGWSRVRTLLYTNDRITPGDDATSRLEVPTVYAITPTYTRHTQRVDLTSLCHTLMHVPEIIWIVVEDAENKTQAVTNLLAKCKFVTSVHLVTKSPNITGMGKGVNQRNAGLNWIRQNCGSNALVKCRGVVYSMDDDNKHDLKLFQEIRKTKSVSVFPVAFAGGLKFEGPICAENGRAASWHTSRAPDRPMPVDMAGFAININLILKNKNAEFGKFSNGTMCGMLETCFLEQFTTRETAECIEGKEVMVWHVKTIAGYYNEKKNPSNETYAV